MSDLEFAPWPKIARLDKNIVTITEKIDGTNGCVIVKDGEVAAVQSRKRFITPDDDNFGFAAWVEDNKQELAKLGDGYYYGEWAGPGIQGNPLSLEEKTFFLFNPHLHLPTPICKQVPMLYYGPYKELDVEYCIQKLWHSSNKKAEGVVIFFHAFGKALKYTYKNERGKWNA